MSEAELHWLRTRLQGGKRSKAEQGSLRFRLPTGLVYDPVGKMVLDPDEAVQEAVRLVFARFEQAGSALAVVSYFAEHRLRFPTRWWGGKCAEELLWGRLTHGRVLNILHNPLYAGAYVYGSTQFRRKSLPGEAPRVKGRTRRLKQEDWPVVLQETHPAYISWETFLSNQRQLDDNRTWRAEEHRGAIREGPSLLQGIVLCGVCGRRMTIRYQRNGTLLMYECHQVHSQLAGRTCQTMRGDRIDQAVVQCFLEAIQPAQLEVALSALDQVEARARQMDRQWHLQLERAQYEADLARRRDIAVEPENRLVARSLEREWNEKLAEVERLEREYARTPKHAALPPVSCPTGADSSAGTRPARHLASANHDLCAAQATDPLVDQGCHALQARQCHRSGGSLANGGADPPGNPTAQKVVGTVPDQASRWLRGSESWRPRIPIRGLRRCSMRRVLSPGREASLRPVKSSGFATPMPSHSAARNVPARLPPGSAGMGATRRGRRQTCGVLDVSTIADWCKLRKLEAGRAMPHGPRWITLNTEIIEALRKPIRRRWTHQSLTT